jgi:hypothetical protein
VVAKSRVSNKNGLSYPYGGLQEEGGKASFSSDHVNQQAFISKLQYLRQESVATRSVIHRVSRYTQKPLKSKAGTQGEDRQEGMMGTF